MKKIFFFVVISMVSLVCNAQEFQEIQLNGCFNLNLHPKRTNTVPSCVTFSNKIEYCYLADENGIVDGRSWDGDYIVVLDRFLQKKKEIKMPNDVKPVRASVFEAGIVCQADDFAVASQTLFNDDEIYEYVGETSDGKCSVYNEYGKKIVDLPIKPAFFVCVNEDDGAKFCYIVENDYNTSSSVYKIIRQTTGVKSNKSNSERSISFEKVIDNGLIRISNGRSAYETDGGKVK